MGKSYVTPNGKCAALGFVDAYWGYLLSKPWGTCIYESNKCKPVRRKELPPRATIAEAQADLDAYAAKRGWTERNR
jgi:hypothetical protein